MEARSQLESKFGTKFTLNKTRIKEKNLVIKVKKNMTEEELKKEQNGDDNEGVSEIKVTNNNSSYDTIMKTNVLNRNIKNELESEIEDKEYRCNIKEEVKESQKPNKSQRIIDDVENYEEETISNENGFMEPLF